MELKVLWIFSSLPTNSANKTLSTLYWKQIQPTKFFLHLKIIKEKTWEDWKIGEKIWYKISKESTLLKVFKTFKLLWALFKSFSTLLTLFSEINEKVKHKIAGVIINAPFYIFCFFFYSVTIVHYQEEDWDNCLQLKVEKNVFKFVKKIICNNKFKNKTTYNRRNTNDHYSQTYRKIETKIFHKNHFLMRLKMTCNFGLIS